MIFDIKDKAGAAKREREVMNYAEEILIPQSEIEDWK